MSPRVQTNGMRIGVGAAVAVLGGAAAWGLGWGFVNDEDLDEHTAAVMPHPILSQAIQNNYDRIQDQQKVIVGDVAEIKQDVKEGFEKIEAKLDRVLDGG